MRVFGELRAGEEKETRGQEEGSFSTYSLAALPFAVIPVDERIRKL